jgi:ankyrin repeat protein
VGCALNVAVLVNNEAAVDALLDAGARVVAPFGKGPLAEATLDGRDALLQRLLERAKPSRAAIAADSTFALKVAGAHSPASIRLLLDAGMNVHVADDILRQTPMHLASTDSIPAVLAMFLEAGLDIHARDAEGFTPLHCAVEVGRLDNVKFLIEHGARTDCRSNDGRTLLHSAVEKRCIETLKHLLTLELDPNAPDQYGNRPLLVAAKLANTEAVSLLLAAHADPSLTSKKGGTALWYAIGTDADANLVAGTPGTAPRDRDSGTLEDRAKCTEMLLDAGLDIETGMADKAHTPLGLACMKGRLPIVTALLRRGARLDNPAGHPDNLLPLHLAAVKGHADVIRALMKAGAKDMKAGKSAAEAYAIHVAVRYDQRDALAALLEGGADVNARDAKGDTPLMYAAAYGKVDAAKTLLNHKADPDATDKSGKNAVSLAEAAGFSEVARVIRQEGSRH